MRAMRATLAACLLAAAVGCGGEPPLPAVSGVATVDGNPLPSGTVTFYPDAAKGNTTPHQPTGIVEAGGKYELYVPDGKKGAPAGWYKVVVFAADDPQPNKPVKFFTSRTYTDVKTTPLSVEVVATPEAGRYDLKLKK
jgi:hypothetical protein